MIYDVIIVGSGPAGLTAGIYGVRAGLKTLILDSSSMTGGQILNTYEIDNYPALPGVSGADLGRLMGEHCNRLGVEFARGKVTSIIDRGNTKEIITKKTTFETKSIIIATGSSNRKLGCDGESEFSGMGVSFCATCDGAFFKDKVVAVVGGGDVALEDAIYLARTCEKVYLIHRRDEFRGAKVLQDAVKNCANIEIIYDSIVEQISGEMAVQSIAVRNVKTDECIDISIDGVFIAVGNIPNTSGIEGLPNMDSAGYIIAGEDCATSIPGIYAAGDVRTKQLRQVITATADGANAITSVCTYLQDMI